MNLFQRGKFVLSSGKASDWKIDADALSDDDIETLAYMIAEMVMTFGRVEGIPRGGLRIAKVLERYVSKYSTRVLVVDDVMTSGASMQRRINEIDAGVIVIGAVIFARGPCPPLVKALFQVNDGLWL